MPLWSALLLLLTAACFIRSADLTWAAFVLLADWAVCTFAAWLAGDQFIWPVLAAIDYTAALLLIVARPSRISALLAMSYVLQGMAHVVFGLGPQGALQRYEYWWTLHDIAWGQAWAVMIGGVWTGGKMARRLRDNLRGLPDRGHRLGIGHTGRDAG